jgi:hypothetical protein
VKITLDEDGYNFDNFSATRTRRKERIKEIGSSRDSSVEREKY